MVEQGEKWGFLKVLMSFPIPSRNKARLALLCPIFSPSSSILSANQT